ncbi:MAG: Farnesyl diphosphate synthase [Legionellaceae bacterium]
MNPSEKITFYQTRFNEVLERFLPKINTSERLLMAMRYTILNGGKRVRPLLVYATGEALQVNWTDLDSIACAIECIHTFSLIHDDLPAMDDDDLRRGLPTCHKAFDEATAILAGDALQTLAFEILAKRENFISVSPEQQLAMIQHLTEATGINGMTGGQSLDLLASGQIVSLAELEKIHRLKTGALIQASIYLVALAANNISKTAINNLLHYANCLGLAFQIQDDILDIEMPTEILGKQQGADISRNKMTYPTLLGLNTAKKQVIQLFNQAIDALALFGEAADFLRIIANIIVKRNN